eukprot:12595584-Ditylum_brightwellii.AAC.1
MIEAATMAQYNHNPIKLMEEMELNYNNIVAVLQEKVFTEHNFTRYISRVLCTASNPDFMTRSTQTCCNKGLFLL